MICHICVHFADGDKQEQVTGRQSKMLNRGDNLWGGWNICHRVRRSRCFRHTHTLTHTQVKCSRNSWQLPFKATVGAVSACLARCRLYAIGWCWKQWCLFAVSERKHVDHQWKMEIISQRTLRHSFATTQTVRSVLVSLVWVKTRSKQSRDYKLEADYTHSSTKHTHGELWFCLHSGGLMFKGTHSASSVIACDSLSCLQRQGGL